jgi:uncharacterized protein (DUF305 family)
MNTAGNGQRGGHGPYRRLALMVFLSFVAMYGLMYAMVDRFANVFSSLNQVYMAGLMAASMVPIELLVMRSMYRDRKANAAALAVGTVALIAFWWAIRAQAAITDRQFLRSMIPHHAGAILMCAEAELSDPALQRLCGEITAAQLREIAIMKQKLEATRP